MDFDNDQIGTLIRKCRKHRGYTLKQVADDVDLSVGYLSDIERNRTTPSLTAMVQIFSALRFWVAISPNGGFFATNTPGGKSNGL